MTSASMSRDIDQLRQATRDAHAAVKDLRLAIKEYRVVVATETLAAIERAVTATMNELADGVNERLTELYTGAERFSASLLRTLDRIAKVERDIQENVLLALNERKLTRGEIPVVTSVNELMQHEAISALFQSRNGDN